MPFSYTFPTAYEGTAALVTFPDGARHKTTGILLCRPWGRDEVSSRKFYKILADTFARHGFPVLRFDYPGTVDSLDLPEGTGLDAWIAAARTGADTLKQCSGCEKIVVFGLGFGAIIAENLASERNDVSGMILAAPVTNGRRYIREIGIHARMIFETEMLPLSLLDTGKVSIVGNVMPDAVARDLEKVKLGETPYSRSLPVLVFAREGTGADTGHAEALREKSHQVTVRPFVGYDALVGNILQARPDMSLIEEAVCWIEKNLKDGLHETESSGTSVPLAVLQTAGFRQTALFVETDEKKLYCVVTSPVNPDGNAPVFIFGNTGGYDHQGGRTRDLVETSRRLALKGVISVRFAGTNTGDSYPDLPLNQETLYTDLATQDFLDLIDHFSARFPGPVTLVGRCSSAYSAFHAAARDERVRQLILINQLKFVWDPDVPIDLNHMGHRSTEQYKKRLTSSRTFKRLLCGEINLKKAATGLLKLVRLRASARLAAVFPKLTKFGRLKAAALEKFDVLNQRQVPVHFFCSVGDESVSLLRSHFGPDFQLFARYPNITYQSVDNADHNFLPDHSRQELAAFMVSVAEATVREATGDGKETADRDGPASSHSGVAQAV